MGNTQVRAQDVKAGDKVRFLGPGTIFRTVETVEVDPQREGGLVIVARASEGSLPFYAHQPATSLVWVADPDARF